MLSEFFKLFAPRCEAGPEAGCWERGDGTLNEQLKTDSAAFFIFLLVKIRLDKLIFYRVGKFFLL